MSIRCIVMPTLDKFLEECGDVVKPMLSSKTVNVVGISKEEKERILNELLEETKLYASIDTEEHRR